MSIVFDRAVGYYDQTRALPEEIAALPAESLVRETGLQAGGRMLELGVGTGRIAIPMAQRIGPLIGVDLSLPMMGALQEKLSAHPLPIRLAQADVLALPFPDATFDLEFAVHVLHLVEGWRDAAAEAKRTLKPGGHFAVNWHRRTPDSPNAILRKELRRLAGQHGVDTRRPGAQSEEEIISELANLGMHTRVAQVFDWTESDTPRTILDELDRQIYSETWMIPRRVMDQVIGPLRTFAESAFGSLDAQINSPYSFGWIIAEKPR